ncbi:MAG: tetrathionate reductase family octaheme c-type cytochrome [Anaerolineales bacterium]
MPYSKYYWIFGLIAILAILIVPVVIFSPQEAQAAQNPRDFLPVRPVHVSHADIIKGPFETPQDVTRTCLGCHPDAAKEVMATSHWTWESQPVNVPWRDEPVTIGKANQINNFCISAQGNQKSCTSCHIGYGWQETDDYSQAYDFNKAENVDCLVCHAQSGYAKGQYGNPAEGVDLLAAARSVAAPTRTNCGNCHFNGGGGNNVKHGDLSGALYFPSPEMDVHMGANDMICTDCHRTEKHQIKGRLLADNYQINPAEQVQCTDCHAPTPHEDARLNNHTDSVACQTCHIPFIATKDPTKTIWDWSTSGEDRGDNHFTYLKIKGSFQYETNVEPTYAWFNGNNAYRYLLGDKIDPTQVTMINQPAGSIQDPTAKIFPFKVHKAIQPYDTVYNTLLAPITSGPDGYWTTFDWQSAFELAQKRVGIPYSGSYGFTETWMYWPSTHLVQPASQALQCADCHSEGGRMDWKALGYPGDPIQWGGRTVNP